MYARPVLVSKYVLQWRKPFVTNWRDLLVGEGRIQLLDISDIHETTDGAIFKATSASIHEPQEFAAALEKLVARLLPVLTQEPSQGAAGNSPHPPPGRGPAPTHTVYKCLVISPGDVDDARAAISEVIDRWNYHAGDEKGAIIQPVRWELHSRPQMGDRPQELLNRQIVDNCQFGVAVFWSRLGSPTGEHESGSVEEIRRLRRLKREVMVYFCTRDVPQDLLDPEQFARLQRVKTELRAEGMTASFGTTDELKAAFFGHLQGFMTGFHAAATGTPGGTPPVASAPAIRVIVKEGQAFVPGYAPRNLVSVEIQNHSERAFFLGAVQVEFPDGTVGHLVYDAITKNPFERRRIEPGDSASVWIEPSDLRDVLGAEAVSVVAVDKIDRRYASQPGQVARALASLRG